VTRICPPRAVSQARVARMTAVPNESPSSRIGAPVLIPTASSIAAKPESVGIRSIFVIPVVVTMLGNNEEIRDLLFTYAARMDAGDFVGVGKLFADATYRSAGGAAFRGAEPLREVLAANVILYDGVPRTKHLTTNVIVTVDPSGETAQARSYFSVLQSLEDFSLQTIVAGQYEDRFVRCESVWRFADRLVRMELLGDLSRHLVMS
jgi:3-phenylpropionate/cinnamic acid dioxygenase small subunit